MKQKIYMILLVDRKRTKLFTLQAGKVGSKEDYENGDVPQRVRHGDDTWDAQNKIFRHIEDHLHRHLQEVGKNALAFAKKHNVDSIIIGGHRPLFEKIEKHLPYPLPRKLRGRFVTELKAPFGEIIKKAKVRIAKLEAEEELKKLEMSLLG